MIANFQKAHYWELAQCWSHQSFFICLKTKYDVGNAFVNCETVEIAEIYSPRESRIPLFSTLYSVLLLLLTNFREINRMSSIYFDLTKILQKLKNWSIHTYSV